MSAALAYAPSRLSPTAPVRHVEIVTTRAQRRARPKSFYAVTTVMAVFGLFLAQLLLSIVLSAGAYQISSLQAEQKDLSRTQQDLSEKLDLLASPQSLATRAGALGMVVGGGTPAFLRLSDGALIGTPVASGTSAGTTGLVANALLVSDGESGTTSEGDESAVTASDGGAPPPSAASASVASNDGDLPSPVTR
jgi:hypothetical protein